MNSNNSLTPNDSINTKTNNKLSAQNYILLTLLYSIPIIGWIFAFKHSTDKSNITRAKYAKAICYLIIVFVIAVIIALIYFAFIFILSAKMAQALENF